MNEPERQVSQPAGRADAAWRRLLRAARSARPDDAARLIGDAQPPAGFADGVLALARSRGPAMRPQDEERRVLSWAAALAIAASLLIAVSSWSDLAATFGSGPGVLFEEVTRWEPLP